jgi:hypothetical protein
MSPSPTEVPRPRVVTIAVVLWWAVCASQLGFGVAAVIHAGGSVASEIAFSVLTVGWTLWVAWGALRLGRGSGRARFWLAVVGALSVLSVIVALFSGPPAFGHLESLAAGVAAMLPYLPAARPFFPRAASRRKRPPEPVIVGWDPNTGEPIRASE